MGFKANYTGIGRMLKSDWMLAEMVKVAEKIKAQAEATAPVETGDYKASFEIRKTKNGGDKKDRAVATVVNTSPHAVFVEFGTEHHEAQRVMGRARDAAKG